MFARQLVDVIPNQRERIDPGDHGCQSLATTTGGRFAAGPSQSLPEGELGDLQAQFVEYRSSMGSVVADALLTALLGTGGRCAGAGALPVAEGFSLAAHFMTTILVFVLADAAGLLGKAADDSRFGFSFCGAIQHGRFRLEGEGHRNFPLYAGLGSRRRSPFFLDRTENKTNSGWVAWSQSLYRRAGVEFCAAGDAGHRCAGGHHQVRGRRTHLGGDWNPDEPIGFKMYPLALKLVRDSLAELERQGVRYRLEGFMWHQGENDMFNEDYMKNYGPNLKNYLAKWRRDLKSPKLKFYIGELCTKTIWGMDLRPRMYAISGGQRAVTEVDPLAEYVPTSHVGVEIGHPVGTLPTVPWPTAAQRQLRLAVCDRLASAGPARRWAMAVQGARSTCSSSPGIATWRANGHSCRTRPSLAKPIC